MSELRLVAPPGRDALRRQLRGALGRLGRPLRVLAEDLEGLDGRIDLVAADPSGRVVLVLVGEAGEELALVAQGLAQRAWLEPRLGDWLKLAPDLEVRPQLGIELLLVAAEFGSAARAAARAADPEAIILARSRFVAAADEGGPRLVLELEAAPPSTAARSPRPLRSVFRTGLSEADLGPATTPRA